MRTYTGMRNKYGTLSNNTSSANLTLGDELINDSLRYLITKYFFNERTQNVPGGTVASQQAYNLPFNIKTMLNVYITIGNLRYSLKECPTRLFWDQLNFAPYTSDIPQYYFIFNKQCYVFPTPASSGNALTYVYKIRVADLSQADYTTGTVAVTTLTSVVTGAATAWSQSMVGRWIQIAPSSTDANNGDNQWYEIATVGSATSLTLVNQYQGATVSGAASYTIGEVSLLPEDYQDLPTYRALQIYFTTRVPDPNRAEEFKALYLEGFKKLDTEFGSKSNSVAITAANAEMANPNLFIRSIG